MSHSKWFLSVHWNFFILFLLLCLYSWSFSLNPTILVKISSENRIRKFRVCYGRPIKRKNFFEDFACVGLMTKGWRIPEFVSKILVSVVRYNLLWPRGDVSVLCGSPRHGPSVLFEPSSVSDFLGGWNSESRKNTKHRMGVIGRKFKLLLRGTLFFFLFLTRSNNTFTNNPLKERSPKKYIRSLFQLCCRSYHQGTHPPLFTHLPLPLPMSPRGPRTATRSRSRPTEHEPTLDNNKKCNVRFQIWQTHILHKVSPSWS